MIRLSKCLTEEAVKEPLEKKLQDGSINKLVAEVPVIKKGSKKCKKTEMQLPGFPMFQAKRSSCILETKGFLLIGQVNETVFSNIVNKRVAFTGKS